MTILVCEDNPRMHQLIVARLAAAGADVVECADGEAALARYRELRPAWVVLDLERDGAAGLRAARRIVEHDAAARVVLMAASPDDEARSAARRAGAWACLAKEDLSALVALIAGA